MNNVYVIKAKDGFDYALSANSAFRSEEDNYDNLNMQLIKSKYGNIYVFYDIANLEKLYLKMLLNKELTNKLIDASYLQDEISFKIKDELKTIYRLKLDNNDEIMIGKIIIVQNDICLYINFDFTIKSTNQYLDRGSVEKYVVYNNLENKCAKELLNYFIDDNSNINNFPLIFGNTSKNEVLLKYLDKEEIVKEDNFICQL